MTLPAALRLVLAGALGAAAALLVSCGGSGKGLIPATNAGLLQSDFDAVAQAVSAGNCPGTASAIRRAMADFQSLPSSIDPGLRDTLSRGIANLNSRALVACAQAQTQTTAPTTQATTTHTTTTTTTPTTISTTTTTPPPTTTTTPPTTTTSTPTATTPPPAGGGTPAPAGAGAGNGGAGAGGAVGSGQ